MRLNKSSKEDKPTGRSTGTSRTNRFRGSVQQGAPSATSPPPQHSQSSAPSSSASTSKTSTPSRLFRSSSFSSSTLAAAAAGVVPSQQRIAALVHDAKRYWKYRRQPHRDTLPHHRKSSRAWHVDFPKRIVWWTATVFLLGPLILFTWREVHRTTADDHTVSHQNKAVLLPHHNVFPDWFPEEDVNSEDKKDPDELVNPPIEDHDAVGLLDSKDNAQKEDVPIVLALDNSNSTINEDVDSEKENELFDDEEEETTEKVHEVATEKGMGFDNETIIEVDLEENEEPV